MSKCVVTSCTANIQTANQSKNPTKAVNIINVRITHKTAHVPLLEAVSFKDKAGAYAQIQQLYGVQESMLIQTCNRVELYLVSKDVPKTVKSTMDYLQNRLSASNMTAGNAIEYAVNMDALNHLLRTTSGLESMVIGEDQVINQVWNAYLEAQKFQAAGPILELLFNRAVKAGRRVRHETGINRGAVSVGSAAVELAENLLGCLNDKKILVMGAGETATLVAKAMARRCLSPIFIANRTYERALRLADELGGKAVGFDKLSEVLIDADVVFCSTSAPHYLLTKDLLAPLIVERQNKSRLLVVDVSNPRNVEESIKELPRVKLCNIDDITAITKLNKSKRQKNACKAAKILIEELNRLERALKAGSINATVSSLLSQVEKTRQKELSEALNKMSNLNKRQRKIINNLTVTMLKQTFLPLVENLRLAAENNQTDLIEEATKIIEIVDTRKL